MFAEMTCRGIWQRDDRALVYQHEGRVRYPSITRTADGRMLVLFSRTKHRSTTLKQFDELAPEIGAEEYDALQPTCSKYVIAIRQALAR